ncbi:L-2-hydroxyglutarate oxidase LhgO [Silvibacterium bohemicum]|uniref:L-2-hydroxyglutarate oxidase LhgO n=1 Tax=Silvibacterium bohemicum TaxID=1577686 RepID=A0A841JY42_9BACT|nr:L-2-hydroxyglutarate oxidase [Silvibacterium bohemicum]MBB6142894.1 L-2-hydroxyglutarate oxidase LhgO [Silvibacterium bohemicum]
MPKRSNAVAIIGGGIVGLATGLEFTRRWPGISVAVIEKESSLAGHQTSHNSGVIHSGIYYKPGSLKARLCVEGATALVRFCSENGVPYDICGKVIVAITESEIPRLEELFRRGQGNGLEGLRILQREEIREIEPYATGVRGIQVPSTGIVDYARVAGKYAELIAAQGGSIHLSHEVIGLKRYPGYTVVETTQGPVEARLVVNCAGLHSDRISRMAKAKLDLTIVPFRGEYYDIVPEKHHYIKGLLYPVPDPRFPFLGVHFTRRIGGGVEAGPNAVLALKREGYSRTSFLASDVAGYLTFPGFWIMAAKNWQMSVGEYRRSWSKAAFVRALQRLMPELSAEDLVPGGSGVRAQALGIDGKLIDDFHFAYTEGIVHVCNVPSPAATASLAIGKHIVDTIVQRGGIDLAAVN